MEPMAARSDKGTEPKCQVRRSATKISATAPRKRNALMPIPLSSKEAAKLGLGKKRSKYGAVRTEVDGIKFASKREAARYSELKLLVRAGKICGLVADKQELRWPLEVNGQRICIYEADFVYREGLFENSPRIVEDVKGFRTPAYRLKRKLMKAIHGIDIREI